MLNNRLIIATILVLTVIALGAASVEAKKGGGGKPPKNPTATPVPTATPEPCVGCPEIHVVDIVVGSTKLPKGGSTRGSCRVYIQDAQGNYIVGATVEHQWSGAVSATQYDVTAPREVGSPATWVQIDGPKCPKPNKPDLVYTCTVGSVSAPGYTYAPEDNVEDSDSSTVWQCG